MNKIYCVGVGPGDPELLTLKAHKLIRNASQIAYFRKRNTPGRARTTIEKTIQKKNVYEYIRQIFDRLDIGEVRNGVLNIS